VIPIRPVAPAEAGVREGAAGQAPTEAGQPDAAMPLHDASAAAAAYLRPGTLQLGALPPLSLYVHLPWCLRKCPYCDFNSHEWRTGSPSDDNPAAALPGGAGPPEAGRAPLPEAAYLEALRADLEQALPLVWGRRVTSVFIGGGTPSLFSPDAIATLVADIRSRLTLVPGAEITLEANPGTFERDRFRAFHAAGVTRLSIGVQSFDDTALAQLGRVHDAAQAHAAVAEAAAVFETFNLDLMYALPGQSLAALRQDLRTALAFAPPHLSVYHLTLEPNTRFAVEPPSDLPDEDLAAEMLDTITAACASEGMDRYEVSAYARPGHRCRHNLNYWGFGDYLGIGAGAHGKLSFPHRVVRQVRWREPATYMRQALAGQAVSNAHELKRRDLPFEFMMNALRLREGFDLRWFGERTGLPISAIADTLSAAEARGLVERDLATHWLRPTPRGFDFLSDLQAMFLPKVKD
jgi:putative oxygen-independent coproporphyrinogen III oxidase